MDKKGIFRKIKASELCKPSDFNMWRVRKLGMPVIAVDVLRGGLLHVVLGEGEFVVHPDQKLWAYWGPR
jgi:hypothetical protein